ncbi:MAG: sulfurtransferase [Gammaproteobacteria bacterium]|nr:sulfurtransferase [Gammaproteobacteria bacterium]
MKFLKTLLISILALTWVNVAYAVNLSGPLVETDWLAKNKGDVVILEIRKDVKSFKKKPVFKKNKKTGKSKLKKVAGHIPGSILVNYKKLRSKKKIDGRTVVKMIVSKSAFEKLMQASGVNKNSAVVIVSKGQGDGDVTMATRLYWQMKYYGHDNMAILNGGMAQWIVDKRKVSSKAIKAKKGNWIATAERNEIFATSKDVAAAVKAKSQLVDTRPISLYLGTWRKKSYVFANGHIPGAKPYPNELLSSKMPAKFLKVSDSKSLFEQMGIKTDKKSITYCNSGHLATGSWFVLSELMGNKNVKMYDGSMHQWTLEKRDVTKMEME